LICRDVQVVVPVVVTDKKGHSVNGLRPSDFQIVEDGVPQSIVAFTREIASAPGAAPALPATANSVNAGIVGVTTMTTAPKQMWAICFDALHTSLANFVRAKEAIDKLLSNKPRAEDQFVLFSIGRQLRVIQPATTMLTP
jgi:VWFA-related protein